LNTKDIKPNIGLLNKCRQKTGPFATRENDIHGLFFFPIPGKISTHKIKVISSGFEGQPNIGSAEKYYHVSASLAFRCPTWEEMCFIKSVFYGENVTVVQYHPKKSEYVNIHNFTLHLWLDLEEEIILPDGILV